MRVMARPCTTTNDPTWLHTALQQHQIGLSRTYTHEQTNGNRAWSRNVAIIANGCPDLVAAATPCATTLTNRVRLLDS